MSPASRMIGIQGSITQGVSRHNQDGCGFISGENSLACWVIDGASCVEKSNVSATLDPTMWLVKRLSHSLEELSLATNPAHLVSLCLERIQKEYKTDLKAYVSENYKCAPSANLSWVRLSEYGERGVVCEYVGVGDCRCFTSSKREVLEVSEVREEYDETDHQKLVQHLMWVEGLSVQEVNERLKTGLLNVRKKQQMSIKYALLNPDSAIIPSVIHKQLKFYDKTYVVLMSDGFFRLVDYYKMYSTEELVYRIVSGNMRALYSELRSIEKDDATAIKYPRCKISDDATALLAMWVP